MNAPAEPSAQTPPTSRRIGLGRQLAVSLFVSTIVCLVLMYMAFSLATSLLIGLGVCLLVMVGSAVSYLFEMVVGAIAAVIFGIFAAIAAVFAVILDLFG